MKKFIAFLVLALLISVGPAFALSCKEGNFGSDECWTTVRVSLQETTPVTAGTVLVYDVNQSSPNADTSAFQVRVADASADAWFVAGVAQKTIATGDTGLILVRGQGQLSHKSTEAWASGDALFVSTSRDASKVQVTGTRQLGFALETVAVSGNYRATDDAYITIV